MKSKEYVLRDALYEYIVFHMKIYKNSNYGVKRAVKLINLMVKEIINLIRIKED